MNAVRLCSGTVLLVMAGPALSAPPADAVERGKAALLGRAFNPPAFSFKAYDNVWKVWGLKDKPSDFARLFRERYGLAAAPYANGPYPMGLRESSGLFGKGLTTDCLACHGGSIMGKSIVGLGNASGDYQALLEELAQADGKKGKLPFHFTRVRGTSEAGAMAVFLLELRKPDLSLNSDTRIDLGLHDDLCEDAPAWWLLKKKKTMYHTGGGDARSVRTNMQFMLSPTNSASVFAKEEKTFADIQAYLLSIEAPKYPFPVDRGIAGQGEKLFVRDCSRCHGTYGEKWTYPNRVVPLKEIGTDPTRYHGITREFNDYYNQTWFAKENGGAYKGRLTGGYQAPPLDGVWATAPYFHNGSAPTVYHVLNSMERPRIFTRSYRTDREDYDEKKLGWKVTVLEQPPGEKLPAIERRKVYDTTQPGRGNAGHTFGDKLTDTERLALIEYLKTL